MDRPDKEKLLAYLDEIAAIRVPEVEYEAVNLRYQVANKLIQTIVECRQLLNHETEPAKEPGK